MSIHKFRATMPRNHRNMGPYRHNLMARPLVQRNFNYFWGSIIGTQTEVALAKMMGLAHAKRPS